MYCEEVFSIGGSSERPFRRLTSDLWHLTSVFSWPGSDLLFQALRLSTIGAGEFNGRVRDGIGYRLPARTTRPAKDRYQKSAISDQNVTDRLLRKLVFAFIGMIAI